MDGWREGGREGGMEMGMKRKGEGNEWMTRMLNEKCRAFTNNGHAVIWHCEAVIMNISFSCESHTDGGYLRPTI